MYKNSHVLKVAVLTCLEIMLSMTGNAHAENSKETGTKMLSDEDFLGKMPVILSASRLSQPPAEAPAATTVIDRDMISASGARELVDLFRLVPGFQVGYANGHWQTVTYHGLADTYAKRLQVLVDGRSIYTPAFGGVQWSDLPLALDDIERIEVIRGPNMASYGANAFQGVINIITRHASQDAGTRIKAIAGSKGVAEGFLRHSGTNGNLDYRFTVGHREDNGFDNRNDSKRVSLATLRADYRPNINDTVMFQFGLNAGPRGMGEPPTQDNPTPTNNEHTRTVNSRYEQLRWQRSMNAGQEISIQLFHNYHQASEAWLTPPLKVIGGAQLPMNEDVTAQRYDLELQHNLSPFENWRFVWGASTRIDQVTSPTFLGTTQTLNHRLHRLFASSEWRITPTWLLNMGAMLEKNDITSTDIAPRLAVNYLINERHSLRASVSKALRTPVIYENRADYKATFGPKLNHLYLGSNTLMPETIVSQEMGYLGNFPAAHLALDIKIFQDEIKSLISAGQTSYAADNVDGKTRQFLNGDNTTIRGAETQIKYTPQKSTQVILSYAYTDINSSNYWIRYSTTAPTNSLSLLAMQNLPGNLRGSLGYYQTDKVYYIGMVTAESAGAMKRLDLRLARPFRGGEIAVVAQNVLNGYQEYRYQNIFDSRWYATLTLDLQ